MPGEFLALHLAELDSIAYIHPCLLAAGGLNGQLNRMAGLSRSAKTFTHTQGQYLAFIHAYTRLHRRPPAETDMQEYFPCQSAFGSPDGVDARTRGVHQKATEGRPQYRTAR